MRDCPLSAVTPAKIKSLRDEKGDKRGAANGRLKTFVRDVRMGD